MLSLFPWCPLRDKGKIINKKSKSFKGGKKNIKNVFLKTTVIDLEPTITLDYPLHWFPLRVGVMECQWRCHQADLEPGFGSSLCGMEETCYSRWEWEERGGKTHLITPSLWLTWHHWMITENYSVTKMSWLKPESCRWSEIKPHSVILMPGSFPVVCCIIETNWKIYIRTNKYK